MIVVLFTFAGAIDGRQIHLVLPAFLQAGDFDLELIRVVYVVVDGGFLVDAAPVLRFAGVHVVADQDSVGLLRLVPLQQDGVLAQLAPFEK